jgi:hypothetical protein
MRETVTASFSSIPQSVPVINIYPLHGKAGVVRIELGYPSRKAFKGEGTRGDERVRQALRALGKLLVTSGQKHAEPLGRG